MSVDSRPKRILILTSHGIRTNAKWQELLEQLVETELLERDRIARSNPELVTETPSVTFLHNDYKFFSLFSFINPFRRRGETKRFEQRLRAFIQSEDYDEIHLVGHSFGTHIIGHSLRRLGDELGGKIGTVILAGSVLPGTFRWDELFRTGIKRLVNECGDRDAILVLNAILPFGSGLAGRRGFAGVTGDHFRNRFFQFGHSGYFQKRDPDGADERWFMRKYWLPLLLGEKTTPYVDERSDSTTHLFRGWLVDQSEGLKWLIPGGIAALALLVTMYFALLWRTSFNVETVEIAGRIVDDVERHQLHDVASRVNQRQHEIEQNAGSALARLEGVFRSNATESYNPDPWERARTMAKFALLPRRSLSSLDATAVRFRGDDYVAVTYFDHDEEGTAAPRRTNVVFDIASGAVSASPMWDWTGPFAAPVDRPGAPKVTSSRNLAEVNLQASIEDEIAVSLSSAGISSWRISDERSLATWPAASWGNMRISEARACGRRGDAIALTEDGEVLVLHAGGVVRKLAAPESAFRQALGSQNCRSFAAERVDGRLAVWASDTDRAWFVRNHSTVSFEFSPGEEGTILLNSTSDGVENNSGAGIIRVAADIELAPIAVDGSPVAEATFAPSDGLLIFTNYSDADFRMNCGIAALRANDGPAATYGALSKFPCPKGSDLAGAVSLAETVRLLDTNRAYLTTRAHRGSFGDAYLELKNTRTTSTEWLAKASRYDIISFDSTPDASVVVTTSGDSAGEGYGADRSFNVWSQFANDPVYKDARDPSLRWEAKRAWVGKDGRNAVVVWQRFDDTSDSVFDTELVSLVLDPPDKTEDFSTLSWGLKSPRDTGTQRGCNGLPEGTVWLTLSQVNDLGTDLENGCGLGGLLFIAAAIDNGRAQVRFEQGPDSWNIRVREDPDAVETPVRYENNTTVPDDVVDFVSDPLGRRMFLVHKDGGITRVDFLPKLSAVRIAGPAAENTQQTDRNLAWMADNERLVVYTSDANEPGARRSLSIMSPDGRVIRQITLPDDLVRDAAAGGAFDSSDNYWSPVEVRNENAVPSAEVAAPDDVGISTTRYLENLETGKRISYACDEEPYGGSPSVYDPLPNRVRTSRSGTFLAVGHTAPTAGAAVDNTEMRSFDLKSGKCLGIFRHGDEIYDFAISSDGRLVVTQGLNETFIWHTPTRSMVKTFYGPTRIVQDEEGLRIVSRANSKTPSVWTVPDSLSEWLAESSR